MAHVQFGPQQPEVEEDLVNWDEVPDEELEETAFERFEGLKEMFPAPVRSAVTTTVQLTWVVAQNSFSFARSAAWVLSTSALLMVMPYIVDKELHDVEKAQLKQQQQLLLGGRPS
ncbi:hypothetical protein niasHS_013372 [Heterodera schachtii]|uniref:Mitochondrial import receptor subunit TOM22 homolog n=1 Tax=Heterodera schachtii TaxID=97005 RepID=A0ABD2I3S5_HETSC